MILYEVVRSDTIVARGIIISVNPKTTLGALHHDTKISDGRYDAKSGYNDRQSDAKKL